MSVGTAAFLLAWMWLIWLVAWWLLAVWRKPTARLAPARVEITQRGLVIAGALLIFWRPPPMLARPLYAAPPALLAALVAAAGAGFGLTFWARFILGSNWSARVMLKQKHELVRKGPYGRVRHPIYTGILLALAATAAVRGEILPYAGVAVILAGLTVKARAEEQILGQNLAGYAEYRRETGMFLPRLVRRGNGR